MNVYICEKRFPARALVETKGKKVVKSKLDYKLRKLIPENKFTVDPSIDNPLQKYVAWSAKGGIEKHGRERLGMFCTFFSKLSDIVVDMAEKGYFDSAERVEIAHDMSWMLGCTEYGSLTTRQMEVGYYDRVEDRCHSYLKQSFGKD